MKIKALVLSVAVVATIFTGCGKKAEPAPAPKTEAKTEAKTEDKKADVVTTASIVNNEEAFVKAISKDGKWIIATLNDLKIDKDLVLEGEFKNNKGDVQRKIAPYTQDDKRNITNKFTITAPKLTIKSPMASIQHGTFKGDVYVEVPNFQLIDAKIDGNLYFANEDAQKTFKMDDKSSVTGKQEIKK